MRVLALDLALTFAAGDRAEGCLILEVPQHAFAHHKIPALYNFFLEKTEIILEEEEEERRVY